MSETMTVVAYDRYGGPDGLRLEERPIAEPDGNEVLIRVQATSINLSDWECLLGRPAYARIGGLRRPGTTVLGSDIAGRVEAVGPDVTRFAVGDAVYGDNLQAKGGFGEYALAPESVLAPKPDELSFAEASTIPQAGAIALQGSAEFGPGDRVLINGGGGGSGMFIIQLAAEAGAHVTAVDNEGKLDFMKDLGADRVFDYRETDFTRTGDRYDHILDLVAHRSVLAYRRALADGGRYHCVGGSIPTLLSTLISGAIIGRRSNRRLGVLMVQEGPEHFGPLADRCASGEIDIHIDRTFPLAETAAALVHHGGGHALGKVVVRVGDEE